MNGRDSRRVAADAPDGRRRALVLGLVAAAVVARAPYARGQAAGGVRRVGWLDLGSAATSMPFLKVLPESLRELGWVEGQNIAFEWVFAEGKSENLPGLVAELLRRKIDVIVTSGTTAIRAAKDATSTVPIVMAGGGDPVGTGLVQSIARPGGNITGVSLLGRELMEKNLDLLKQALPGVMTVTMIRAAANPGNRFFFEHMDRAARRLGLRVTPVDIRDAEGIDPALRDIGADAAFMLLDPLFFTHRERMAEVAIARRLPLMTGTRVFAEAGFLLTHGVGFTEWMRATAPFVDKILRGARPGDLPIEQPSKLDLVVNLRTARAIGRTIPPAVLLRADHIIE